MLAEDGRRVMFVADPEKTPKDKSVIYKRPDDLAHEEQTWRDILCKYNHQYKRDPSGNPLGLLPAWELYEPRPPYRDIYRELVSTFGVKNVFILSAGWGLIPACFLTPNYNITVAPQAEAYKRRRKRNHYEDISMLPKDIRKTVVFLGGQDYIPLFCRLTENVRSERIVFYNSKYPPDTPGCELCHFQTKAKIIWPYKCAIELIRGDIDICYFNGKKKNPGSTL